MYTLQPATATAKPKNYFWHIVLGVILLVMVVAAMLSMFKPSPTPRVFGSDGRQISGPTSSGVTLRAKSWNNGYVHMWADISEGGDHTDVPESARCAKLDDSTYKLGSGSTAIYYFKLSCDGVVGYVEVDQVN